MKSSKKLLSLLMASALTLSLAACGNDTASTPTPAPNNGGTPTTTTDPGSSEALTIDQVWPAGTTVTIDVPAKAGGGTDLYTRYLTQALGEVVPGVNFVVTNYDTGEVGMEHAKNADPDGLTLGVGHGGAIIQYLSGSSNVNVKDDYKTVGVMNLGGPQAIIAKPNAPYTNFTELGEYAKANPGEVIIGCSLGGTTQMIFTSLMDSLTGDPSLANYVQCSSEADKLTQTASGSIDIANCSLPNAQSYLADGKLTVLGVIGPGMATLENMGELLGMELSDDFMTGPEQGVDTATWDSSYYVWVPASTPDNICEAINSALMQATEVQSYIDGNQQMATFINPIDLPTAQQIFTDEWNFMDALVSDMGLKVR